MVGALTAAGHGHKEGILINTDVFGSLFLRGVDNGASHRHPGHNDIFRVFHLSCRIGISEAEAIRHRRQFQIRFAHFGVGFMKKGLHAAGRAGAHHGEGGVPSGTHDQIRPVFGNDLFGHSVRLPYQIGVFQQNQRIFTAESLYGQQFIRKFLIRHNRLFNAVFGTDIQNIRSEFREFAADSQSGIEMSAGTAAADDHFHPISPFGKRVDKFSSTPTAIMVNTSELPP